MSNAKEIYATLAKHCEGWETAYEDHIISIIGIDGLIELRKAKLIESCAVINGRKLYAL